jgi:3-hydroxyisobutyrate dehydrogenase
MKVGLVGVGVMGDPMARNLKKAGHDVMVFNRTPERCEPLRPLGIEVARTAYDVFSWSETTIVMVATQTEVDQVLGRDPKGAVQAPVQGKSVILMATVAPSYSEELGASLAAVGTRYVEAPISGSKRPAELAELVILASAGDPAFIDEVQPVFDAIGRKTVRFGAPPMAMRMKLANQILLISWFEAITEATYFAKGVGLDVQTFLGMMEAGPLANAVLRSKVTKLVNEDFSQEAPIRHVSKDIGLVCDEARQRGLTLPIASANRNLFLQAMQSGQSQDDAIGILKILRRQSSP